MTTSERHGKYDLKTIDGGDRVVLEHLPSGETYEFAEDGTFSAPAQSVERQSVTERQATPPWWFGATQYQLRREYPTPLLSVTASDVNKIGQILPRSEGDPWEDAAIGWQSCLYDYDNDQIKLWYTGDNSTHSQRRIGYATSDDGLTGHSFTRTDQGINGSSLVFNTASSGWDDEHIGECDVFKFGDTYDMLYSGSATQTEYWESIGHATSTDGINWTRDGSNPVLTAGASGAWDETRIGTPRRFFYGGLQYMLYIGINSGGTQQMGVAYSTDGSSWTKFSGNPVMGSGSGWEATRARQPVPIYMTPEGDLLIAYSGYASGNIQGGFAVIRDFPSSNVERYTNNPVFVNDGAGGFDSVYSRARQIWPAPSGDKWRVEVSGGDTASGQKLGVYEIPINTPLV